MYILLTNDDGVFAPGLKALHRALAARHEVFVAAPETEQSAVGHAITLADPIRVRELNGAYDMTGYAIQGTPADCVKLAMHELMDRKPDLVVSGINHGGNLGYNILYSGTVSAASEAAIMGLPSLAVSLNDYQREPDFLPAAGYAAQVVELYPSLELPPNISLNMNVPPLPRGQIQGVRWCRQSTARFTENFLKRQDPRGRTYFWQDGETTDAQDLPDSDFAAVRQGWITLTPIRHDLTDQEHLLRLTGRRVELA